MKALSGKHNIKKIITIVIAVLVGAVVLAYAYIDYNRPEKKEARSYFKSLQANYDNAVSKIDNTTPTYIIDQLRAFGKPLPSDSMWEKTKHYVPYVALDIALGMFGMQESLEHARLFIITAFINVKPKDTNNPVIVELTKGRNYDFFIGSDNETYMLLREPRNLRQGIIKDQSPIYSGVLITGVYAPTVGDETLPVVIELFDLPSIKCFTTAAAKGVFSGRVFIEFNEIKCRKKGSSADIVLNIPGWVVDEDMEKGLKGRLMSKYDPALSEEFAPVVEIKKRKVRIALAQGEYE